MPSPIFTPYAAISPITADISIGGLLSYAEPADLAVFDFILNVAWELTDSMGGVEQISTGQTVRHGRLDDSDDEGDIARQVPEIERLVHLVTSARARGDRVLVTCAMGRNRSALVIAEHLIREGHDPRSTVRLIQSARDKALTNRAFVAWLLRKR